LLFFLALLSTASVQADVVLNGLIVDRTYTRFGKEFYSAYSQKLSSARFDFNITIEEKFLPRVGSLIKVYGDRSLIFGRVLGRKNSEMEGHVNLALNATSGFIARRRVPEINPDLHGEGYK